MYAWKRERQTNMNRSMPGKVSRSLTDIHGCLNISSIVSLSEGLVFSRPLMRSLAGESKSPL